MWTNPPGGGALPGQLGTDACTKDCESTLNSVLKISKTGTLFTVFPTKNTPLHYVLSLYFTPNHSGLQIIYLFIFLFFFSLDLRKLTLFSTKMPFFLTLNDDSALHCPAWKKSTLSRRFFFFFLFCSSIDTKSTSKRPALVPDPPPSTHTQWNKCIAKYDICSPHTTRLPRYAHVFF